MTVNEAAALAKAADSLDRLAGLTEDLSARITRLENAFCIFLSDETLPRQIRMDVASAMLPSLEQAA